ncbi:MAG: class I SAM-dependent methyltransferase [Planctomycetaceae bacterium]
MHKPSNITRTELEQPRSALKHAWNLAGLPFRFVLFPDHWNRNLGWSSLEEERLRAVFPAIRGRLLDIGAGPNTLCRLYGSNSVGVDVYDFGGGATIVEDTRHLPFADQSFDTVTFVACLNHIPYRLDVLREARRLLRPGGRVVATMINRALGDVGHKIWWYSEDKERGMLEGETGGLDVAEMRQLFVEAGFVDMTLSRFCYGLNGLFVATRPSRIAGGRESRPSRAA